MGEGAFGKVFKVHKKLVKNVNNGKLVTESSNTHKALVESSNKSNKINSNRSSN